MIKDALSWFAPGLWWLITLLLALTLAGVIITVYFRMTSQRTEIRALADQRLGGLVVIFAALVAALAYWTPFAVGPR